MSRDWKPGDVAASVAYGYRSIYVHNCAQHDRDQCWHNESGFSDPVSDPRRPLVVIDPEDRDQVAKIAGRYAEQIGANPFNIQRVRDMQAALRSLIAPSKPDEPTGLGAVVEDGYGHRYVRTGWPQAPWCNVNEEQSCTWSHVAAVKVLSDGVQP